MQIVLRIQPEGTQVVIPASLPLPEALLTAGTAIALPCGGKGTCGRCRVRFLGTAPVPTPEEFAEVSSNELEAGWRLACRHILTDSAEIYVPPSSQWVPAKDFFAQMPAVWAHRYRRFLLRVPNDCSLQSEDLRAYVNEHLRQHGHTHPTWLGRAPLDLPKSLSYTPTRLQVDLYDDYVLRVHISERAATRSPLGLAVDLGTTTLAAALVDLETGEVLAADSTLNPQARVGADVMSRIRYAMESPEGTTRLHEAVVRGIEELSRRLIQSTPHAYEDILVAVAVGNPTMMHTLFGESPQSLGQAPYLGLWYGPRIEAVSCGHFELLPHLLLVGGPMISGHVGADLVAAAVATELLAQPQPVLLLDIGTNCELALWDGQTLWVTSAPAGPAFEAATISSGMRAEPGAIDHVAFLSDGQVLIHTIGGGAPKGICGAGLIDVLALLLEIEGVDAAGNLQPARECVESLRIQPSAHGPFYELNIFVHGSQVPVTLTQADVRALQLAKSAIRAALEVLLHESQITPAELTRIYLAGSFGAHLRASSLQRLGVLPEDVAPDRILSVGNAAGAGAVHMLCRREAWEQALQLARSANYVELAGMPLFDEIFIEHMQFPSRP